MKKTVRKAFSYLLATAFAGACLVACGEGNEPPEPALPLDAQHGIADQENLFGICYLMEERSVESLDIEAEVLLMKNLGVKTVRQWMHFTHFMSDPVTIKEGTTLDNMHALLAACEEAGMVNIGMNHHNFCTTKSVSTVSKPFARDISEGSEYVQWLNDYYTSWKTLVTEFPEVVYWEIDNEVNNPAFMTSGSDTIYTVRQMAEIATDMFYYASRAIHEVNPDAQTIMGGLTEPNGLGKGNTANFLQMLYDNIAGGEYGYFYNLEDPSEASRNADDYFQIACWHPYMSNFNQQHFIEINNEYYEIILRNEGKHKKVFFTELGWNDDTIGGEDVSIEYLTLTYEALRQMPYVETANLFKLYDNGTKNNWDGPNFLYFGLVHDPDPLHVYTPIEGDEEAINIDASGICIPGAPKRKAYVFQELANGSGDLEILVG